MPRRDLGHEVDETGGYMPLLKSAVAWKTNDYRAAGATSICVGGSVELYLIFQHPPLMFSLQV